MTMEQVTGPDAALLQAVRPSASLMAADEELLVRLLHEDIGSFVRQLPDGGWSFCERTARIVLWLTGPDQPTEAVAEAMAWFAAANHADGFPPSEYVSVGHALVRVAREMSGMRWTSATGSAWIRFFMWMQSHLRAAAQQAPAQATTPAGGQDAQQPTGGGPAGEAPTAGRREAIGQAREVDVTAVASLLHDEDEEEESHSGYDHVMLGMIGPRLSPPQHRPTSQE